MLDFDGVKHDLNLRTVAAIGESFFFLVQATRDAADSPLHRRTLKENVPHDR